ncbi:MAG TPA: hypothetical protein VN980_08740, partial [Alphaproteobacteria bacterium]|nr:hypothetical protein [Alphaproteobacteria bacterium]
MADKPRLASEIRDWVQTVVIVLGVGAGIWQFEVKEIWTPAAAPINVTTELTVKEAGFRGASSNENKEQFEAIELSIVAKNPSTRDVYLLANCWEAVGLVIATHNESQDWTKTITERLEKTQPSNKGAYYEWQKAHMVAAGEVFLEDEVLHPNESVSTTHVFYVPKDVYDVLHVRLVLPTTAIADSAEAV